MRPLKSWPEWMLRAVVTLGKQRRLWAEAYFELIERAKDAADAHAELERELGHNVWSSGAPPGMH